MRQAFPAVTPGQVAGSRKCSGKQAAPAPRLFQVGMPRPHRLGRFPQMVAQGQHQQFERQELRSFEQLSHRKHLADARTPVIGHGLGRE